MSKQNRVPQFKKNYTRTVVEAVVFLVSGGICFSLLISLVMGNVMRADPVWIGGILKNPAATLLITAVLLVFMVFLAGCGSFDQDRGLLRPASATVLNSGKPPASPDDPSGYPKCPLDYCLISDLPPFTRKSILARDLPGALENNEFELLYQPICDLAGGRNTTLEALLRWNHPRLGIILPEEFIQIAEETGVIIDIGSWVLHKACNDLKDYISQGYGHAVSVNISSVQLLDSSLPEYIAQVMRETGIEPEHLLLELTESGNIHKSEIFWVIQQLNEMGMRIVLDDFGSGYSSYSNLKNLPVESLKLDKSLVSGVNFNKKDAIIVDSIIRMAHALGIKVIAEGIETEEQLRMLQKLGCDLGQGYFLGRPERKADLNGLFSYYEVFSLLAP